MIIKTKFIHLLLNGYEYDTCSKLRHWLANKGLCKHKMKRVRSLKDDFYSCYGIEEEK